MLRSSVTEDLHSRCILRPTFKATLNIKVTSLRGCKKPDPLNVVLCTLVLEHFEN
jgi:hypothetical protein